MTKLEVLQALKDGKAIYTGIQAINLLGNTFLVSDITGTGTAEYLEVLTSINSNTCRFFSEREVTLEEHLKFREKCEEVLKKQIDNNKLDETEIMPEGYFNKLIEDERLEDNND